MHGHDSFAVNCNSLYPCPWHLKIHHSCAKEIVWFHSNKKITASAPLYFLIIKPTWHSFKPFHPATPGAPLLVVRARVWDASLLFSAAPRSALRHGAQIDDTGCLEISAPQQDFSYKQPPIHELALITCNRVYRVQKYFYIQCANFEYVWWTRRSDTESWRQCWQLPNPNEALSRRWVFNLHICNRVVFRDI